MDSKQFCQLLFAKGVESGMSIEEIDRKMNASYGRSFVKDLECGTRKFSMDSIMKYIDIIGLSLVIIDSHSVNAASNYDQLLELCSKKCRHFPFRKGRVDAYGVRSWVPSSKWEVVNDWLYLSGFLWRIGKFGYEVDVMNDEQINRFKIEQAKKVHKQSNINLLIVFIMGLMVVPMFMIACFGCEYAWKLFEHISDWLRLYTPDHYFGSLLWSFIGVFLWFIVCPIILLVIVCIGLFPVFYLVGKLNEYINCKKLNDKN